MHYFGGKARLSKEIVKVLKGYRKNKQPFIEPFCGGVNITCLMGDNVFASDINCDLISMYKAIQNGWTPPEHVSENDYEMAKTSSDSKLKAFIGIGCSFSGKWFGGYARCNTNRNYAKNAKNSLLKKFKTMGDVTFLCRDYTDIDCVGALIYCDPPYNNTTKYNVGDFSSETFWQWCRDMTIKGNTVIISEYSAPSDFRCIWTKETKTDMRTKANGREKRIEKLFIYNS